MSVRCCWLLLAGLLGACGGDSGGGQSVVPTNGKATVPPVGTQASTGHYVGAVTIAGVSYFGDAVFTQDGAARLYLGGPYDNGGKLQLTRPESSEQFVGTIAMHDKQWSGSGLIIGQQCAINAASGFCGQPAPADFSATVQLDTGGSGSADLQGEVRGTTSSGTDTWLLNLGLWSDPGLATTYKKLPKELA